MSKSHCPMLEDRGVDIAQSGDDNPHIAGICYNECPTSRCIFEFVTRCKERRDIKIELNEYLYQKEDI